MTCDVIIPKVLHMGIISTAGGLHVPLQSKKLLQLYEGLLKVQTPQRIHSKVHSGQV